ncbi:MAG TPA: hypothetical protein VN841_23335 [Bryobacteraceae bacterium]|nr:hypothetical protein [Bryobacteraceae bacterium]
MPDFSRPGSDGSLPAGVPEWRDNLGQLAERGLIYTVRSHNLASCHQQYRIVAVFKQKIASGTEFTAYADLYRRVTRLAHARAAELSCPDHGEALHARVLRHSWSRIPGQAHDFPCAVCVVELACPRSERTEGESEPTPQALKEPGGTPPEKFAGLTMQRADEFYNEYDVCDPPGMSTDPVTFSYGEYVETCDGIDFEPFLERAENRARFHYDLIAGRPGSAKAPFAVLRRDWWAIADAKFVVVVVYFQL